MVERGKAINLTLESFVVNFRIKLVTMAFQWNIVKTCKYFLESEVMFVENVHHKVDNGWISVGPVISEESFRVLPRDAKFSFLFFFLFL